MEFSKITPFVIKYGYAKSKACRFYTHAIFQFYDSIEFTDKLMPKSKTVHKLESLTDTSAFHNTANDSEKMN